MNPQKTGKNMLILFLFCVASYLIILPALLNVTRTALDTVYESVAESPESAQVGAALPVQKTAYLTFDDGPSRVTPQVLDLLKSEGIHATFFVTYHEYLSLIHICSSPRGSAHSSSPSSPRSRAQTASARGCGSPRRSRRGSRPPRTCGCRSRRRGSAAGPPP